MSGSNPLSCHILSETTVKPETFKLSLHLRLKHLIHFLT